MLTRLAATPLAVPLGVCVLLIANLAAGCYALLAYDLDVGREPVVRRWLLIRVLLVAVLAVGGMPIAAVLALASYLERRGLYQPAVALDEGVTWPRR